MTTTAATIPLQNAQFRFKATGRVWNSDGDSREGVIRLTGNFFGEGNYVRVFVTPEELIADYESVPA